jgi:serine/threonine protein kinase
MSNLSGQQLGSYRILEQIGYGGLATVYRAYQPALDRYVAIKVLESFLTEKEGFLTHFQHAARTVTALHHPNIVSVHDFGLENGVYYLVTEYIDGSSLSKYLRDMGQKGQTLPLEDTLRIVISIANALDYPHRMEVIHQDVKPAYVLLDAQGNTFLTDFGVTRVLAASVDPTGPGVGIGTPEYMSPEEARGEKPDGRSDIYSLGVVLYEMATGQLPYAANTPMAVLVKHITGPLPLPRSTQPDLPEEIERVILRALAKQPNDRFQTAGELAQALDTVAQAVEGVASPIKETVVDKPRVVSDAEFELTSLRQQLGGERENLLLIEERKSEYVEETAIPLDLIKQERRTRKRVEELERRIAGLEHTVSGKSE